ncbi:hypothetical protein M0802_016568 [Mischocyttarus mexicanus]|nr:hypothetical protein M0802_016568 [Mischocyttarus mexicanus]
MIMTSIIVTAVTCILILNIGVTNSARILAIFPAPSYSHQIVFHSICKNLSLRGHQVTLVTTNPMTDTDLTNFTQIDISYSYKLMTKLNFLENRNDHIWQDLLGTSLFDLTQKLSENVFIQPDFKKIYAPDSKEKFDLVIVEAIATPAIYAFGHRFQAPLIGIYSMGLLQISHYIFGNPVIPSHPSAYELNKSIGLNLPFWKRIHNFVKTWWHIHVICNDKIYKPQQEIAEKYLGKIPSVMELEKNISILFTNQREEISFTRPNELKKFMDNASNDFIYVSLGTNVNPSTLPKNVINAFVDVFSKLPTKVVWKFKGNLPKTSDNIYTAEWFPQQQILGNLSYKDN